MIIALTWAGIFLLCIAFARAKQRSTALWGLLGLLAGPLALLSVIIVTPLNGRRIIGEPLRQRAGLKLCPRCDRELKASSGTCKNCGVMFRDYGREGLIEAQQYTMGSRILMTLFVVSLWFTLLHYFT